MLLKRKQIQAYSAYSAVAKGTKITDAEGEKGQ